MKKILKNTIKVERAIHDLRQEDLARLSGISRQQIHNMEHGADVGIKTCLKLIKCLNKLKIDTGMNVINIGDIFKLEDEKL